MGKGNPVGIRIRHTKFKAVPGSVNVHLVPLMWAPQEPRNMVVGKDECNLCLVVHPMHVVHLHLDDAGSCLVSQGVLDQIKGAAAPALADGLAANELEVVGSTDKPPPLRLDGETDRRQLDQENARIQQAWGNAIHT